ncbi:aminotransferase class I/II-fold pyridoxal phosphate-dependent enzyme [[Actinomadura] parvosata]|uniref:aminotransferase class I/II-fold pyridoxal phosphate-dependent enzyme n=1 Tax=[Actinomadura] parvosata TaxID=1955412 RepID=UPI00406C4739
MSSPDIYLEILTLAARCEAVNLAQGFPDDEDAPLQEAMRRHLRSADQRYAPLPGLPELRQALARRARARGLSYDADSEITVTIGGTEALAAALLAVAEPGSEILTLEPFYDNYPGLARLAGATLVPVPLVGLRTEDEIDIDMAALRAAATRSTRVLLLNTPHNPTGHTLSQRSAADLARFAVERDLVVVTDEVYEEHTYDVPHVRLAAFEGMRERTIVCSSASKMLSAGGWRIGWAYAPPHLTDAIRHQHRHLAFAVPTPLQAGVAAGLGWADETGYFDRLRVEYRSRRDTLCAGLRTLGLSPRIPQSGFFAVADVSPWGASGDIDDFARKVVAEIGVAALPMGEFFTEPDTAGNLMRFAFCKPRHVLQEALRRLSTRFPASAATLH